MASFASANTFQVSTPDVDVVLFTECIHLALGVEHMSFPVVCNLLAMFLYECLNLRLEAFDGNVLDLLCLLS